MEKVLHVYKYEKYLFKTSRKSTSFYSSVFHLGDFIRISVCLDWTGKLSNVNKQKIYYEQNIRKQKEVWTLSLVLKGYFYVWNLFHLLNGCPYFIPQKFKESYILFHVDWYNNIYMSPVRLLDKPVKLWSSFFYEHNGSQEMM